VSDPHAALHERGLRAVLAREEIWEVPPHPSRPRWGVSLVLRPDETSAQRLATLAAQVSAVAGHGHWQTGGLGSAHLTVRVLEPYREPVSLDDPLVRQYAAAAARVGERSPSPRFALTGLLVAPGGVLASAVPANASAAQLRAVLSSELGDAGAFEAHSYRGDAWWASLLHFSAPLDDGAALVGWVEQRRALDLGFFQPRTLDLIRYEYDGARTAPVPLACIPLES
jgi:hypothetical protein